MRIKVNTIKEWELYESEVLDKLKKEFPHAEIKKILENWENTAE